MREDPPLARKQPYRAIVDQDDLLVPHDDDVREYACTDGAERARAPSGRAGWTTASVKDDWNAVLKQRPLQE